MARVDERPSLVVIAHPLQPTRWFEKNPGGERQFIIHMISNDVTVFTPCVFNKLADFVEFVCEYGWKDRYKFLTLICPHPDDRIQLRKRRQS